MQHKKANNVKQCIVSPTNCNTMYFLFKNNSLIMHINGLSNKIIIHAIVLMIDIKEGYRSLTNTIFLLDKRIKCSQCIITNTAQMTVDSPINAKHITS